MINSTSGSGGEAGRFGVFKSFGGYEILLIVGVVLLLFGATRLPQMGHSLGRGFREFKNGITGRTESHDEPKPKGKRSERKSDETHGIRH